MLAFAIIPGNGIRRERRPMSTGTRRTQEYERIRSQIITRMLSVEELQRVQGAVPGTAFGDMMMVYQIEGDDAASCHTITDYDLACYGVTPEQLMRDAISIALRWNPLMLAPISIKVRKDGDADPLARVTLYSMSSRDPRYGASIIAYPNILGIIAQTLERDYYILPFSAQEFVIIPEREGEHKRIFTTENECRELMTHLPSHLSEYVYHYQASTDLLETAPDYTGREMLRAMFRG